MNARALELADWAAGLFSSDGQPKEVAAMLRKQHEAIKVLREALVDCKYGLEGSRIWGGMEWTYNPLHAYKYLPLRDRAENALKDTEEFQ